MSSAQWHIRRGIRRLFRLDLPGRERRNAELDEEIEFHVEARTQQLLQYGLPPDAARAEARARFAAADEGFDETRRRLRRHTRHLGQRMTLRDHAAAVSRDLRQAIRSLRRSPGVTAVVVFTLAIGIGGNTAVFGLVSSVLYRTPPYVDPDRLVTVWQILRISDGRLGASPPEYVDYRDRNRALSGLGGYYNVDVTLGDGGEPEHLNAVMATASVFTTLGVAPVLGRPIAATENRPGGSRVAVLSWGLWQRRFGGDRRVLGRVVTLDEQQVEIVGVMPKGFEFPWRGTPLTERADLWEPMVLTPADLAARASSYDVRMIGRLKPGSTLAQAQDDLERIAAEMRREHPEVYAGNVQTHTAIEPLGKVAGESARPLLLVLGAAVGIVLLVACANIANLLLTRAIVRQREMAVRRALGAASGRLLRHALIEGLVLSLAGTALGLGVGWAAVETIKRLGPDEIAGLQQATIDARTLWLALGLAVGTTLVCAAAPATRWMGLSPQDALRHTTRQVGGSRARHRIHNTLVVSEAASAMVLLVVAGLLISSFIRVLDVPPGFDPDGVFVVRSSFTVDRYRTSAVRQRAQRAILEGLRSIPGVAAASITTHLPIADHRKIGFVVEGQDPNEFHWASNALVDSAYFAVMRIPLRTGRAFSSADVSGTPDVTIINETMARQYWPRQSPLGRAVIWGGRRLSVIGVVGDVHGTALDAPVEPTIYSPIFQAESGATRFGVFVVRVSTGGPAAQSAAVRHAISMVDSNLPVYGESTLRQIVSKSLATRRFLVMLLGGFASVALALAVVGLYGVLAYAVAQRTTELGLRFALGAQPAQVLWMVLRAGLGLVGAGVALGAIVAAAATARIGQLLFEVRPIDPPTYAVAAAILLVVGCAASCVPGARAARVDPATALRGD
jgi:putative ABC transport system permease protein